MSLENNQPVKSDENQEHSAKVDNSRRSFAKKSAAIAPVILTLANRSAWGGTNICSQSGFASYNNVGFIESHVVTNTPNGISWKTYSSWKSSFDNNYLNSTKLEEISSLDFPGDKTKLLDALTPNNTNEALLLAYKVATVLNIQLSVSHSLTAQQYLILTNLKSANNINAYGIFYGNCAS